MKAKTNVNFHNRFDIEVRDAKTGIIKQKGIAENIVLDQMYDRLCNFQTYFNYIHFGTGSGTPEPGVSILFNHLGYKTPETEEVIKSLPTSKWTRKITLNPEEFVDQTITEVGIGYGNNPTNLVTHAMIKDSEGNPLSITKTYLDVIIIYASVFITLNNSENSIFTSAPNQNEMVNYLTGGSINNYGILGLSEINVLGPLNGLIINKKENTQIEIVVDTENRKRILSSRFGIEVTHQFVQGIELFNILKAFLTVSHSIEDYVIGIGDGVEVKFSYNRPEILNPIFKVDGIVSNPLTSEVSTFKNYLSQVSVSEIVKNITGTIGRYLSGIYSDESTDCIIEVKPDSIVGLTLAYEGYGSKDSYGRSSTFYCKLYGSNDNVNFLELNSYAFASGTLDKTSEYTFVEHYKFLRVESYRSRSYGSVGLNKVFIKNDSTIPYVIFNSPPPQDAQITVSGIVPYYPKDENYVLDVTIELQFGEGV